MGPVEKLLREAGELLRDESKRCVTYFATDSFGKPAQPTDRHAVRWCCLGAVERYRWLGNYVDAKTILNTVAKSLGCNGIITLNDEHSWLIDDLFSEAIEYAAEHNL